MTTPANCSRCGAAKELLTSGRSTCRPCKKAYDQKRREADPEYNRAKCLRWAAENRDVAAARSRAWHAANRDRAAEAKRKKYLADGESIRAKNRANFRANPEPYRQRARESTWRKDNPEGARAVGLRRIARERNAICAHGIACVDTKFLKDLYASPCRYCGNPAQHADHYQPIARGGLHCKDNLVPACGPCNMSKGATDPVEWLRGRTG